MAIPLPDLIGLNITFMTLVIVLTVARFWIFRKRAKSIASVASDIGLLLFSAVIITIGGIELNNTFREIHIRRDLEREFGTVQELELFKRLATDQYMKHAFACMVMYTSQLFFLKVAYLGYFIIVRDHLSKNMRRLLYGTCVYALVGFIVALIVQLTVCLPIERNWETGPEACAGLSTVTGSTVQAWTNLTADLLILTIAIATVSVLQLGSNERVALIFVICLGSVSPLICLVRFVQVYKTAVDPPQGSPLPVLKNIYLYGKFECCFAHFAFCLPSLRVLWRRAADSRRSKDKSASISATRSFTRMAGLAGQKRKTVGLDEISLEDMESQRNLKTEGAEIQGVEVREGQTPTPEPEQYRGERRTSSGYLPRVY